VAEPGQHHGLHVERGLGGLAQPLVGQQALLHVEDDV
jgi:hypothetical protein